MPDGGDDLTAVAAIGLTLPGETALGHGRELLIAAAAGIQRALSRQRAAAA